MEHGARPLDPDASRRRMEAAWADFRRVKATPDEWARAQLAGQRATRSSNLGCRSFGMSQCRLVAKRRRIEPAWQRQVRACFGQVPSPASSTELTSDLAPAMSCEPSLTLALAPLHLHAASARALSNRQFERGKQDRAHEAQVQAWALKQSEPSLPSLPLSKSMRLPMDHETLNCCMVVPPALEIGKRLLGAAAKLKGTAQKGLAAQLQSSWCARHAMRRHVGAPAFVPAPADTPSLRHCEKCYDAEWCICDGSPPLHSSLVWFLKNNTAKGRPCKTAYEQCALVVRLHKDSDLGDDPADELFAHVGFGNLNTLRFTLVPLHRESGEQAHAHQGSVQLRCHSFQSLNAYKFVQGLDTDWLAEWTGQLLRVDTQNDISLAPFRADVVLAKPFVPDVSELLWPLPEKLNKINIRNLSSSSRTTRLADRTMPSNLPVEDAEEGELVWPLADEADVWGDVEDNAPWGWGDDTAVDAGAGAASVGGGGDRGHGGPGLSSEAEGGAAQQSDTAAAVLAGPRLGRGEAIICSFGPHALIRLKSGGLSIWCGRHHNCTDSYKCRSDLSSAKWSDDEIMICLKRWCCRGYSIQEDEPLGRDVHKALGPARAHYDRMLTHEEIATVGHLFTADELEGL